MTGVIDTQDYQITGPTIEPLDLEEVKKQRRFASTTLDTLFDMWIGSSRQDFETHTGVQLLTATREYAMDAFPCGDRIELSRPPLRGVVGVFYDVDGEEQTFGADNYVVLPKDCETLEYETFPTPGYIALVSGASWPTPDTTRQSVRIRYTCGFGAAPGFVPELIVYALHLFVGAAHKYGEQIQEGKSQTLQELPYGAKEVMRKAQWNARRVLVPRSSTWLG